MHPHLDDRYVKNAVSHPESPASRRHPRNTAARQSTCSPFIPCLIISSHSRKRLSTGWIVALGVHGAPMTTTTTAAAAANTAATFTLRH